jgi:hypothetical protein
MTHLLNGIDKGKDTGNVYLLRELAAILRKMGVEQRQASKQIVPGVFGRHYRVAIE